MNNSKKPSNIDDGGWQVTVLLGAAFIVGGLFNLIRFLKTGCVATRYSGLVCNMNSDIEFVTDVGTMAIGVFMIRLGLKSKN